MLRGLIEHQLIKFATTIYKCTEGGNTGIRTRKCTRQATLERAQSNAQVVIAIHETMCTAEIEEFIEFIKPTCKNRTPYDFTRKNKNEVLHLTVFL